MKKEEKQKRVEELRRELEKARSVVTSGFEGLTVAQDTELRRKLSQAGARYKVVKNKLLERASAGTPVEAVAQNLRGTTSVAYTEADSVALAKVLTAYAKENPALVFKAGIVEGRVVSLGEMALLASLPSREALFSRVLFLLNATAQRAAFTLSGVARNLAVVVQEGVEKKKFKQTAGN